jgi:hypothetical protein
MVPGDRASRLYIQRCKTFMATLPPPDWDGVYDGDEVEAMEMAPSLSKLTSLLWRPSEMLIGSRSGLEVALKPLQDTAEVFFTHLRVADAQE